MGIGEQFEFEKTGRIDPERKSYHKITQNVDATKLKRIANIIQTAGFNIGGPLEQAKEDGTALDESHVREMLSWSVDYFKQISRILSGKE